MFQLSQSYLNKKGIYMKKFDLILYILKMNPITKEYEEENTFLFLKIYQHEISDLYSSIIDGEKRFLKKSGSEVKALDDDNFLISIDKSFDNGYFMVCRKEILEKVENIRKSIKNILVYHNCCSEPNIVIKTDKSIDEINKLIYLIQYIECDLPSFNDGIYQNDLKTILSEFYKMEIEDYSNQTIDYEIDILNNWEWSSSPSFDEYKKDWEKLNTLNEQEKESYDEAFTKDLYKSAYKKRLELYLINYRLKQIKRKQTEDYKIFSKIKNAVLANDETFFWEGWCGRSVESEKINIKDFIYNRENYAK